MGGPGEAWEQRLLPGVQARQSPQHPGRGSHGLADPGPQDAVDLTASSLQMYLRLGLLGLQRVYCLGLGA